MSEINHGPLGRVTIDEPEEGHLSTMVISDGELRISLEVSGWPKTWAELDKTEARALRQALNEFIGDSGDTDWSEEDHKVVRKALRGYMSDIMALPAATSALNALFKRRRATK